jgi:hypothetical protein
MLATLGGFLALLLGLAILLLPLLATELSRPRDSVWGAVVLLLGLVLVTTADRLSGAPMLGVLCGGLLIGRLGMEVSQARWRLLSEEERLRLWSKERWQTSLSQASAALGQLLTQVGQASAGLSSWLTERRQSRPASTKRWVRPEPEQTPESAVREQLSAETVATIAVETAAVATAAVESMASVERSAEPTASELPPTEAPIQASDSGAPKDGSGQHESVEIPAKAGPVAAVLQGDMPEAHRTEPAVVQPAVIEVRSFEEIDALIESAPALEPEFGKGEADREPAATATPPEQPHSEAG